MEQIPLKHHAEQDLLGLLKESPDSFAPVYKMQKFNPQKLPNNRNEPEDTEKSAPSLNNTEKRRDLKNSLLRKALNKSVISEDSKKLSVSDVLNKPVHISEDLRKLFELKQLNKTLVTSEESEKSLSNKLNNRVIVYKNTKISNKQVVKQIDNNRVKPVKTLVLTKDKQSGDSFFVINDKRVPIKKIQIAQENIKNMCVEKSTNEPKKIQQISSEPKKIQQISSEPKKIQQISSEPKKIQQISNEPNETHRIMKNNSKAEKQILVENSDGSDEVKVKKSKRTGVKTKVRSSGSELDLLNVEEEKVHRKVRKSYVQCNSTILKHKNVLLEIIQKLSVETSNLKRALLIARRKLTLMKIDKSQLEIERRRRDEEVQRLQKIIADFNDESSDIQAEEKKSISDQVDEMKLVLKTESNNKKKCQVDLINLQADLIRTETSLEKQQENTQVKEICTQTLSEMKKEKQSVSVNYVDIESNMTVVEDKEGKNPCLDLNSLYYNPNMKLIGDILFRDINMGVNLNVPKVIAVNNGHGTQMFNGSLQMNSNSKIMLWMCYKMCDKQDEYGDCPIHIAVSKNDVKGVTRQCQALRMRQLSVDIENKDGYTPLQLAVLNKVSASIVQVLKSFDADFSDTDNAGNNIFHLAAENQYLKELHKNNLIDNTYANAINAFNYPGYTPLMIAVKNKNYEDAKVLIDLKANINFQDKTTGKTALFHAVESNSLDLVELLMANGAETWRKNFSGQRLQDTINELDVSPSLKKLFSDMEEAIVEASRAKRIKQHPPLTFISKKIKI